MSDSQKYPLALKSNKQKEDSCFAGWITGFNLTIRLKGLGPYFKKKIVVLLVG